MVLDKLEILKDLFYGFGRDPHVNKGIFDHYLKKTSDTESWILKKAVQELLAGSQSLPRINDLLTSIKRFTPVPEHTTEDCPKCGKDGLIYSIFCFKPDGNRLEVGSMNQKIIKGAHYSSLIIGRCSCLNGEQWSSSSHSNLNKVVEPPNYLYNSKWDTAYESGILARKMSTKAKELSQLPKKKLDTKRPLELQLIKYDKS